MAEEDGADLTSQRADVWLDVACLFKTRSLAQAACRGGKVELTLVVELLQRGEGLIGLAVIREVDGEHVVHLGLLVGGSTLAAILRRPIVSGHPPRPV